MTVQVSNSGVAKEKKGEVKSGAIYVSGIVIKSKVVIIVNIDSDH